MTPTDHFAIRQHKDASDTRLFIILALIAVAGTVAGIYSIARDDYPQRFDTHFQDFTLRSEK